MMAETSGSNNHPAYIPLQEALNLLEISKSNFFYYVSSRQIHKDPQGKKRPAGYNREDILAVKDKLAQKRRRTVSRRKWGGSPSSEIKWVQFTDMPNVLELAFAVFGDAYPGGIDRSIAWLRHNPQLMLAAFDAQDHTRVLGYISLLPLPEQVVIDILAGQRPATTIQSEEIETYERTGSYVLFAEGVVIHPDHPEQLNLMLRHWMQFWCDHYPDRRIEKIYAQATSTQSDILIQKLFFAPRYDLSESAYMLDLRRQGASRFVKQFQRCLQEKEPPRTGSTN